ncbi:hypothetical protein ACFY0A_40840 [Streptomyces sp. NPDC001698]|uniref:hypothetical protein n=1 Tax=Streptomyces sp. NPDC001698 TaxID=3364601 RepID=UPI0036CE971B
MGEPKGAARQGVVIALRPDPQQRNQARRNADDPTPEQPGIRIYAPPVYRDHWDRARWSPRHGATPTAAYACTCGQTGAHTVAALVAEYEAHKSARTGTPASHEEGRAAA